MPGKRIDRSPQKNRNWVLGVRCLVFGVGCWGIMAGQVASVAGQTINGETPQAISPKNTQTPNTGAPKSLWGHQTPNTDLPIYLLRRVVILNLPAPQKDAPPVQERIKTERVKREQRRSRRRKRLFGPAPTVKPQRKLPLPAQAFAAQKPGKPLEPDVVPADQRVAIAQVLLADALTDRLQDRLKIATVPEAELSAALTELNLSPQEAAQPEGAQRLCALLKAQAVLAPRITAVTVNDGVTRDGVLHAVIRISGVQTAMGASTPVSRKASAEAKPNHGLPAELTVAGAGQVPRVMFGSQYMQSQTVAIRLAAQQAAALAVHTLLTGQSAPFMQAGERLAIAPVPAPSTADKLLFTPQGRRLMPNQARDLPSDFSALFIPTLLPLLPDAILTPSQVIAQYDLARDSHQRTVDLNEREKAVNTLGSSLWVDDDMPNIRQAKALAGHLGVDYVLMAHITDIELEEGPPPSEAPAVATAGTGRDRQPARGTKRSGDREREAKAEAVGVLVRVADGSILWHGHATATMSAALSGGTDPSTWPGDRRIAADAARFALVDLQRQLSRYRASFEQ